MPALHLEIEPIDSDRIIARWIWSAPPDKKWPALILVIPADQAENMRVDVEFISGASVEDQLAAIDRFRHLPKYDGPRESASRQAASKASLGDKPSAGFAETLDLFGDLP